MYLKGSSSEKESVSTGVLPEDGAEFGILVLDTVPLVKNDVFPLHLTQIVFVFHYKSIIGQRLMKNDEIKFIKIKEDAQKRLGRH